MRCEFLVLKYTTKLCFQVLLFDGNTYQLKDRLALKATDKTSSRKSFAVKGLAYSPDSTKLASGQTDCVIYVYKIGEKW